MPRWSPYPAETDRALAVGLTEADGDALGALYDAYAGRLYDYVLSVTGETRPAADIVHDVFIDAARRAPRMRDHRDLRAWLYGAARRRVLQHGRADAPFWETDAEFSPVAGVPPGELRELSDAAFRRLDADDQEALLLALRHGLAAGELGVGGGVQDAVPQRGGTLTPEGMPVQPDVASPFTRRWLFTGGGMAGALVAALAAALLITVPAGTVHWNSGPKPTPVISRTPASDALRSPVARGPGNVPPAVRPHGRGTPATPEDHG
ncbi:RNA polymerase sigma factor, partial [Actinomadura kijaniata]|uniref:RNA polymerase sigma factor n=1 Tax=Actinomadura kijaniata TaxID=46161 RepID=UPI003F1BEA8F